MADFDIKSETKLLPLIVPAVLAADNTPITVDTFQTPGFKGCLVGIHVGAGGITFSATDKIEFKLRHGDSATASEHTAVEAGDVIMPYGASAYDTLGTGGIIRDLTAAKAAADAEIYGVGYIGKKRYISLLADFSGTHGTGTAIAAFAVLQHPMVKPLESASIEE